ncbi:MAG: sulfite exporter TauE/SafE family protein [Alphaproteobacteria bacterium]|nr:sulfite exporter TauE/SafE family protein [Alphaproteobacteria bacterium]MBU0793547.1 sulfite exporter TauE/SafE family protein [Alphaproteobacteria bacterium]MBU0876397.1 sulfite exporter TauE/SafE family protein [Alphaproteobacteria bacterium]MBU1770946.1 sulfite exporter TauE/SafE family protein [Alphaproteobacteria bacterium]
MQEGERLLILGAASLAASAISACFSVGGGYVLFGALTWIMPLPSAIAMQSVLSFGSLFSRTHAFWADIDWPIVRTFTAGSLIGVGAGLWLFVRTPEGILSLLLGAMLLVLAWAPKIKWGVRQGASYFGVGILHAVVGTLFGLGAILQPVLLRSSLGRTAIVGTFATCLILLEVLRTAGYASAGFAYASYWPEILVATVTGLAGTWLGKRMVPMLSERHFRFVLRLFITGLGLRFMHKGLA